MEQCLSDLLKAGSQKWQLQQRTSGKYIVQTQSIHQRGKEALRFTNNRSSCGFGLIRSSQLTSDSLLVIFNTSLG